MRTVAVLLALAIVWSCGGAVETTDPSSRTGLGAEGAGGDDTSGGDGSGASGETTSGGSTSSSGGGGSPPDPRVVDSGVHEGCPQDFPVVDDKAFVRSCEDNPDCGAGFVCLAWQGKWCVSLPACAHIQCSCQIPHCKTDQMTTPVVGVVCGSEPNP